MRGAPGPWATQKSVWATHSASYVARWARGAPRCFNVVLQAQGKRLESIGSFSDEWILSMEGRPRPLCQAKISLGHHSASYVAQWARAPLITPKLLNKEAGLKEASVI